MTDILYDNIIRIKDTEFKLITDLIYEKFGISLSKQKKSLVESRLNKIVKQYGMKNYKQYYDYVQKDKSGQLLLGLIDRISTNHTYFFRETEHFNFFRTNLLPFWEKENRDNRNELKVWCAGCSSGEEAYSIAMVIHDYFSKNFINTSRSAILATDISVSVLETAKRGIYTKERIKDAPAEYKHRYFNRKNDDLEVKENIRNMVLFKRFNLNNEVYPFKGKFDIIFCRNVMIYFDTVARLKLLNRFHHFLNKDGHFFIGHSESITRTATNFEYIKPGIYIKA